MDESYYKSKAKDLEKENVALRKSLKEIEDKLYNKLGINRFYIKNVDSMVEELIQSCNKQLQIITLGLDSKMVESI
jgi:hypothetical protein